MDRTTLFFGIRGVDTLPVVSILVVATTLQLACCRSYDEGVWRFQAIRFVTVRGYWAIRIVTGVPDSFPILGPVIVGVLRGGPSVGQGTLNRFFAAHVLVLPLLSSRSLFTFTNGILHVISSAVPAVA